MPKVLNALAYLAGTLVFLGMKFLGFKTPSLAEMVEETQDHESESFTDDGLLRVPIRLLPDVVDIMINDWYPIGFGATHLTPMPDGSFDLLYKEADLSHQHNLVKLDKVNESLMAALDLAHTIQEHEYDVPEDVSDAARTLERLVRSVGN
jgi:hypothetical protein